MENRRVPAASTAGHFLYQPAGNQVNPRLTLVRAGWACSEQREGEREKERETEGERVREREKDSGTRPEPQRAVTKRSLVTHTEAWCACERVGRAS